MRYAIVCLCLLLQAVPFTANAQFSSSVQSGLSLKYLVREPQKKIKNPPVVIMMHGYGSNERDLFELRRFIPDSFVVISARAPYSFEGGERYRWFERDKEQEGYEVVRTQYEHSQNLLLQFIQQVATRYQTTTSKIYVMGFSQGAIMSYSAGLTSSAPIKGIGILSGILPQVIKLQTRKSPTLSKLRIFIAHGTADDILAYSDGKAGYDHLVSLGLKPEFHKYDGMAHTISKETLNDLVAWLVK